MPANAERVLPDGEKESSWKLNSLSGRANFAAVASHDALSNGAESLSWFFEPSARTWPFIPHAPQVIAPLCLPAKCFREMNVSFDCKSQQAKLPSARPRTSLRVSDHEAKHVSK